MANIKISQLPAAASVTNTQEFEVNDSNSSKKVTGTQISAYIGDTYKISLDNSSTKFGVSAGENATGVNNTFIGENAGTNITNSLNVAIGYGAMSATSSAPTPANVAVGSNALANIATGASSNTAIGYRAGETLSSGMFNSFFGGLAGRDLTTGTGNTTLGYQAGSTITVGGNNLVLGYLTEPSAPNVSNEITIGNASHKVMRMPWTVTVANLPSAATVGAGARSFVTDANSTTFASVVVGGGANSVPVYSDGTDWRIG